LDCGKIHDGNLIRLASGMSGSQERREARQLKIKLRLVSCFSRHESVRQLTTFTTQSTTTSPQKHHDLHAVSPKTPAKTPIHHATKKLLNQTAKGRDFSRPWLLVVRVGLGVD
jgi:hypothetical protein